MIIRQFLASTQHASAGRRAEAASALARAYLHGNLAPDAAWEAKTALLALLDDPSALVRRALAEACAGSDVAPRTLIVALASDQPDIACLVLARSPVLMDADLVDCAAIGCETTRAAIAGRGDLSKPVAAALAEVAGSESLIALARNPHAEIGKAAFLRMIERHGDDATLREALLTRADLAIEVRQAIASRLADSLAAFSRECGWVSPERGARMAREARESATLSLGDEVGEAGLARLVAHLRAEGQLNPGLILRAILTLRFPFVEAAFADLSGLSRARVAGLLLDPRSSAFAALHRKTGLPPLLLPAIQAALSAWRDSVKGRTELAGARLSRQMIERALTACETLPFAEGRGLMALLARFEAEAAREEAREIAQAMTEQAERAEILRLEQEDRALLAAPEPDPVPAEADAPSLDAVLDELPSALVAGYRAEQEQKNAVAAQDVLDSLPDALMASFLSQHALPSAAEITLSMPEPADMTDEAPKRPHKVALAVAASMIPEEVILSYRADRERVHLAA